MELPASVRKRLRPFAIHNVTLYIIIGQSFLYVLTWTELLLPETVALIPAKVLDGEIWRIFTFAFIPPVTNPIFAFFTWYLFYLMGSALERYWGALHYNLYLFIAWLMTVVSSFIIPDVPGTNVFVMTSVFLAFAFLYPEFQLYLFFLLPVRIKWLALITWLGYGYQLIFGTLMIRLMILASVANFLLFFASDIRRKMIGAHRRMEERTESLASRKKAFHKCTVCGITDITHPKMEFRYCPECEGTRGYCTGHIRNHQHIERE